MNTDNTASEFLRMVDNSRRLGKLLFAMMEGPKERPHKIALLDDLGEIGKAKLKEISAKTGQSAQNLCILYNGFEKEGLVAREVDPSDRRNTYYSLTKKGEKVLHKSKGKAKRATEIIFSKLSSEDLANLKSSLNKVNNIVEKAIEGASHNS